MPLFPPECADGWWRFSTLGGSVGVGEDAGVLEVLDELLDKACPEELRAKESPRSAAGVGPGGSIGVEEDAGVIEVLDELLDKAFPEELLAIARHGISDQCSRGMVKRLRSRRIAR